MACLDTKESLVCVVSTDLIIRNLTMKPNKFEIAAELDTEEKRYMYLSKIYGLDQDTIEMTDYIDTVKLAAEGHPKELLLSKQWQQGYQCCHSRTQEIIEDALESALTFSITTTLNAAARLCIGVDVVSELNAHSFLSENGSHRLLKILKTTADNLNADAFCMYDPEIHPDLGKPIKGGEEQLFYWTEVMLNQSTN